MVKTLYFLDIDFRGPKYCKVYSRNSHTITNSNLTPKNASDKKDGENIPRFFSKKHWSVSINFLI